MIDEHNVVVTELSDGEAKTARDTRGGTKEQSLSRWIFFLDGAEA